MADVPALTVSALNAKIRMALEGSFRGLWVEGELSNVKINAASGHAYFSLKDARAQVGAVMFAGRLRGVSFRLADGVKVRVYGSVSVYEPRGQYQLVVERMERVGAGDLMAQFEELKRKLAAEGLFDPARKRPLPLLPRIVGIATSPTGAAIRDMFNVTCRRCPNMRIVLAPCRVQGDEAAHEVAEAIRLFNGMPEADRPDVLIIGRGGGSAEDLWCFNDEALARTIAASAIPVISAVGHEVDFTISDFVADVRAPTPSAAAELVAGRKDEFLATLDARHTAMAREVRYALDSAKARVARARDHRVFSQPQSLVQQHRQHLDLLDASLRAALSGATANARRRVEAAQPRMRLAANRAQESERTRLSPLPLRLQAAFKAELATRASRLGLVAGRLGAMNPLAVLQRGYGIVRGADGRILRSVKDVAPGDEITARVADGEFQAQVLSAGNNSSGKTDVLPMGKPRRNRKKAEPEHDDRQMTLL